MPICNLDQAEFAKLFMDVAVAEGCEILDPVAYQLRHTGATADRATKARDQAGVKRRGRWLSDSSLRTYLDILGAAQVVKAMSNKKLGPAMAAASSHWPLYFC